MQGRWPRAVQKCSGVPPSMALIRALTRHVTQYRTCRHNERSPARAFDQPPQTVKLAVVSGVMCGCAADAVTAR